MSEVAVTNLSSRRADTPAVLFTAAAAAASTVVGVIIATGHNRLALLPVAALFALWGLTKPRALLVLSIAVLSIAYDPARFKISRLTLPEALLMLAFAGVLIGRRLRFEKVGIALAILIGCDLLSVQVSVDHGLSRHQAILYARVLVGLLAYWIADAGFREDRNVTFWLLTSLTCAIAALSIAQEFTHHHLFIGDWGPQAIVAPQPDGFLRIRPPGDLIYVVSFFVLARLIWGPRDRSRRTWLLSALLAGSVLVSLNRNYIVGIVIAVAAALLAGGLQTRSALRVAGLGATAAVMMVAAIGSPIGSRILSLGNPTALTQGTLSDRAYEDHYALRTLKKAPILGVGWAPYGALTNSTPGQGYPTLVPRPFIHNQYLGLWLRTGILGLGVFCFALLVSFWRAARRFRDTHDWVAAGALMAIVGVAASSMVGMYVLQMASIIPLAIVLALCSSWGRADTPAASIPEAQLHE